MLNNFQKNVQKIVIQIGKDEISPNRLEIVHNDFYDFRSMYGKMLFSSYREQSIGDIVNIFGIPRKYITKFMKTRYCIDCEAYVRGVKMLEERIDKLEEKINRNEELLEKIYAGLCARDEPIQTSQEIFDEPVEELKYSAESLIEAIIEIGSTIYPAEDSIDFAIDLLRIGIDGRYPIIREEDRVICLAFNDYLPGIKEELSQTLGVVGSLFSPAICGPESTVILIDCEKQHLRAKSYKIGVSEWLIH